PPKRYPPSSLVTAVAPRPRNTPESVGRTTVTSPADSITTTAPLRGVPVPASITNPVTTPSGDAWSADCAERENAGRANDMAANASRVAGNSGVLDIVSSNTTYQQGDF